MQGFGHVDEETPELAVSLCASYRGRGMGTALMTRMLRELKARGCTKTSLSVHRKNPALKLYRRLGYRTAKERDEDLVLEYVF